MKAKPLPPLKELVERVTYNPKTGIFMWVKYCGAQRYGGTAGRPCPRGYLRIMHKGQNIQMHRVAWLFMTGEDPGQMQVDHRDGNKSNNRWKNLRLVSPVINSQNMREPGQLNTSGYLGVSWCKRTGLFRATIKVDGRQKSLKYHATAELAHEAYLKAKRELHPGCTI